MSALTQMSAGLIKRRVKHAVETIKRPGPLSSIYGMNNFSKWPPKIHLTPYLYFCYSYNDNIGIKMYFFEVNEYSRVVFKTKKTLVFSVP